MLKGIVVLSLVIAPLLVLAQEDEVEGPWGTQNGNISGTASTDAIPYLWAKGPMRIAWELDVRSMGLDRVPAYNPITFDAAGNIYWKTSIGGGTGGRPRVASVNPAGELRWISNDATVDPPVVDDLGAVYDSTVVVVGKNAVYALGAEAVNEPKFIVAYNKETGARLWKTELDESMCGAFAGNTYDVLTPVLYKGKLYLVLANANIPPTMSVYQVNAADGKLDWYDFLDTATYTIPRGSLTLVPDAFGAGEHGLYFNGDSTSNTDGIPEMWAVKVMSGGAELAWAVDGGKVWRSHIIYSATTNTLYAPTYGDYLGLTMYSYVPATIYAAPNNYKQAVTNFTGNGGGCFDVVCLDFNGTDIIYGSFDGYLVRYMDKGADPMESAMAYDDPYPTGIGYWGEYRMTGQLLKGPDGHSVFITGTNSAQAADPSYSGQVVAIDVTASPGELLWQFDTEFFEDGGYPTPGGPLTGPDGKIYWFHRSLGKLIALTGPPVAAFTATPPSGTAPLDVAFDASGSKSGTTIASYAWEFGDTGTGSGATVNHTFAAVGDYTVKLTVTDDVGWTGEKTMTISVCTPPTASFTATPESGPVPLDVSFDASASTGATLAYAWEFGDTGTGTGATATHSFAAVGDYVVKLTVTDKCGLTAEATKTISVKPAGTEFKRGDTNASGELNIADPVYLLSYLFADGAAMTCMETGDCNNDGDLNIADPIALLGYLFADNPPLPDPFDCGLDPPDETPSDLTCESYEPCEAP
jgi:PKD repeat protein